MNAYPMYRRVLVVGRRLVGVVVCGSVLVLGMLWWGHNRAVILPTPDGPYPIGRVAYDWTDRHRLDPLDPISTHQRTLNVWIWYPAERGASRTKPAPYLPPAWVAARAPVLSLDTFLMQNPARVQAHSIANAPLATDQARYPVVIMQPGLGPILADYTTLAESLASHGYIVVGSTPTESASVVVFNTGDVVAGTPQGNVPDTATLTETHRILDTLLQTWVADDRFVLDQVTLLNAGDPTYRFAGHLNLAAVGVLGHSFGGATAAQVCRLDQRCTAGVDLDGYLYGDVVQVGLRKPFMFLWSEPSTTNDTFWQRAMRDADAVYQRLPSGSIRATIRGTRHFNVADYAIEWAPVLWLQDGLGPIDGARGLHITTTYVRAFFDATLRHVHDPILDASTSPYPEIQLERR